MAAIGLADYRSAPQLLELELNGEPLSAEAYQRSLEQLVIPAPPACPFVMRTLVRLHPQRNTSLEGLYVSGGLFATQCEAEGFRRITYHSDRPDLLSRLRLRIEAERDACPVLLSNGNGIEAGPLPPDPVTGAARYYAVWDAPFPKPSYLFALVALRLHMEPGDAPYTAHALASLQRAMAWSTTSMNTTSWPCTISIWARWRTRASTSSTPGSCSPTLKPPPMANWSGSKV